MTVVVKTIEELKNDPEIRLHGRNFHSPGYSMLMSSDMQEHLCGKTIFCWRNTVTNLLHTKYSAISTHGDWIIEKWMIKEVITE